MKKDAEAQHIPREFPAVVTTIVGGRPPGCGTNIGQIPRGIEVLVKKASVDAAFRSRLLATRSAAAHEIGLSLEPAEAMMLDLVPAAQLEAIIAQTRVEPSKQPLFLGKAAAVMLAALGASAIIAPAQVQATKGVRYEGPIATAPTQPTTQAATNTAATPAVPREVVLALVKQLDRGPTNDRDEAQEKLEALGPYALAPLRAILKQGGLSDEATARTKKAMWNIKSTTQPYAGPVANKEAIARALAFLAKVQDSAATSPTTVPTTTPAAVRDQIPPILKQLDSEKFKDREEAQKKLQALGLDAMPALRDILKGEVSPEVAGRIRSAMMNIKATTRPALLNPPQPEPMPMMTFGISARPEPQPTENPED
jgi:hypothetical protein